MHFSSNADTTLLHYNIMQILSQVKKKKIFQCLIKDHFYIISIISNINLWGNDNTFFLKNRVISKTPYNVLYENYYSNNDKNYNFIRKL